MTRCRVEASAPVDVPPDVVYGILADYEEGHPRILPRRWFGDLEVAEGGRGAGTVIEFTVRLAGRTRHVRARVTEPEPGRVLAETDVETGAVTTFVVDGLDGGRRCRVTISTTWEAAGLRGRIEAWLAPGMLRRIYREELANLAREAAART